MSEIKLACDVVKQVRAICDKHGNQPGELINILHEAQHLHGYLPEEMQRIIAAQLGIPVSRVYGVVTFYTFFTMLPKGKLPSPCVWVPPATCVVRRNCSKSSNACWALKWAKRLRTASSPSTACVA